MPIFTEDQQNAHMAFYHPGRMMGGTKISPKGHLCVWNANICTKKFGKIWFGDLDLTTDEQKLIELAKGFGEELYILREMDARFTTEANPRFDRAVACVTGSGLALCDERDI